MHLRASRQVSASAPRNMVRTNIPMIDVFNSLVESQKLPVFARAGEWVRYSTPAPGGAEYVAVCLPAFSPERVHRDA